MGRKAKTDRAEVMERVDSVARLLSQALGSYLLSSTFKNEESGSELFSGANCFCAQVNAVDAPRSRK